VQQPPPENPDWNLGETLRFMQGMWALMHALDVRSKQMSRQLGVTGPQRLVVRVLGRNPGSTAGEIAAILEMHPSTLSGILARLEARRMITRKVDSADRRRSRFQLTAAGKKVDRERRGTVEESVKKALAQIGDRAAAECAEVMRALVAELERT
jgi:DNA-binding MarR family transcriptional regulator